MKTIFLFYAIVLLYTTQSLSQNWTSIASLKIDAYGASDLIVFQNNLYIGGGFNQVNGDSSYFSCQWDGSNITPHAVFVDGKNVELFGIFHDSLYATGDFNFGSGTQGVAVWNGTQWQSASTFPHIGCAIYADSNDLYVGEYKGPVHVKTGNGPFVAMPPLFNVNAGWTFALTKFNDEIFVAGILYGYNGVTFNHIARWADTSWQPLGGGVTHEIGIARWIRCMAVFNDELYVGGHFKYVDGMPINSIAKWNGASWSAVGSGLYVVNDMKVIGNKLYVVGDFTQAGGVDANFIASWNGTEWNDEGFNVAGVSWLDCIEEYQNDIYVGIKNPSIDPITHVYRRAINTGMDAERDWVNINIYPNPASETLHFSFDDPAPGNYSVDIYSLSGVLMYHKAIQSNYVVNLDFLAKGAYSVLIRKKDKVIDRRKLIII